MKYFLTFEHPWREARRADARRRIRGITVFRMMIAMATKTRKCPGCATPIEGSKRRKAADLCSECYRRAVAHLLRPSAN